MPVGGTVTCAPPLEVRISLHRAVPDARGQGHGSLTPVAERRGLPVGRKTPSLSSPTYSSLPTSPLRTPCRRPRSWRRPDGTAPRAFVSLGSAARGLPVQASPHARIARAIRGVSRAGVADSSTHQKTSVNRHLATRSLECANAGIVAAGLNASADCCPAGEPKPFERNLTREP